MPVIQTPVTSKVFMRVRKRPSAYWRTNFRARSDEKPHRGPPCSSGEFIRRLRVGAACLFLKMDKAP